MRLASLVCAVMLFVPAAGHAADAVDAADARTVVAMARQRVENTDSRATGHLVRVDASGKRTSNAFVIKAHWFPGVLRVLLEIVPSPTTAGNAGQDAGQEAGQDARVSVLFEMRPDGQSAVRVFRPHEPAPVALPVAKWGEGVAGSDFDYEDFLQPEFYWRNQTLLPSERLGNHDCDVLKSTPGASDHSHYAEVHTWFDHTTGYPLYVEKTQKNGGAVKDFTSLGLTRSGGVWAARQVEVKVAGRPGSSLLIFDRGSTKAHLSAKDFSPEQIGKFEDHP